MVPEGSAQPGTPPALTEWPVQPDGIPQSDVERQRQLSEQVQSAQNPATPAPQLAPEPAQPKLEQPPPPRQTSRPPAQRQPQPPAPVAAARIPEPAAPPPAAPKFTPAAGSYDDVLKQAAGMVVSKQYAQAQALLNRAIEANPAGWQAYNAIAKIELYSLNQPAQAFDHYRAALARGGVATLRVSHRAWRRMVECFPGNAEFKADDSAHTFDTAARQRSEKEQGRHYQNGQRPPRHVHIAAGQRPKLQF